MKTILIYGNNAVSHFIINALNFLDYNTVDITLSEDISKYFGTSHNIEAIIDTSNSVIEIDETNQLFHNKEELTELLLYSNRYKVPFLFLFREHPETTTDSPIAVGLENIKIHQKISSSIAKIQIEDIYGPDLNTSDTLEEFLTAIEHRTKLVIENDLGEVYLLNQRDFVGGIIEVIKEISEGEKSKSYTLFPEFPIPEIELAHLVNELTGNKIEIEYLTEESPRAALAEVDTDATYPNDWYPKVELEEGLIEMIDFRGIGVKNSKIQETEIPDYPTEGDIMGDEELLPIEEQHDELSEEIIPDTSDDVIEEIKDDPLDIFKSSAVEDISTNYEIGATYYRPERKEEITSNITSTIKKKPKLTKKKVTSTILALLIVSTMLPSITYVSRYQSSIASIEKASYFLSQGDYINAEKKSANAISMSEALNSTPIYVKLFSQITGKTESEIHNGNEIIKKVATAQNNVALAYITIEKDFSELNSNEPKVLGANTEITMRSHSDKIGELIDEINAIKNASFIYSEDKINEIIKNTSKIADNTQKIDVNLLYNFFGFGKSEKYLAFTINPNKITSAGGEISQIDLIEFNKGTATLIKSINIEEYNSKILESGENTNTFNFIKLFKNREIFNIEDLVWEIDFSNASKLAIETFSTSYNEPIDGVLFVSQEIKNDLLQNPDINLNRTNVLKDLISYLSEKKILAFNKQSGIYSSLIKSDWMNTLKSYEDDYVYVIDAEMSDTYIASNITRNTSMFITTEAQDDNFNRILKLEYANSSDLEFLTHVRVLVPNNVLFDTADILKNNSRVSISRSVNVSEYSNRAEISFDLMIEPKSSIAVEIAYHSPYRSFDDKTIDLTVQKQAGINEGRMLIRAIYPNGIPNEIAKKHATDGNQVIFEIEPREDATVEIPT